MGDPTPQTPLPSSLSMTGVPPLPPYLMAFTASADEHRRFEFRFSEQDTRTGFVGAYPELDALCERIGFGWKLSVAEWSRNSRWVMNELARGARPPARDAGDDLRSATLTELVEHLLKAHHQPMRWELNRLSVLMNTLADAHHDWSDIQALKCDFGHLHDALLIHLLQEEREAFPLCVELEKRHHSTLTFDPAQIDVLHGMAMGHQETSDDLKRLRDLAERASVSNDPDAKLVVQGLIAMHDDLLLHTMIENEILLPAAMFACELLATRRGSNVSSSPSSPVPHLSRTCHAPHATMMS